MKKKLLTLIGSICLILVLAALLLPACAKEVAPPTGEEAQLKAQIAELEKKLAEAEAAPEVIKWRLQTPFPTGFTTYRVPDHLCSIINDMSGGRLSIKCFPGAAIVPALTEMHAVHEGTLDATFTGSHYHTSEVGMAGDLFNLYPAGLSPRETIAWVCDGGGMELWQEMYDRKGLNIKALFAGVNGAELFGWYSKPILSLEDFEGLKFRTAGIWGEMVTEMGAAVVFTPGGEIYPSMERGVIDAFEFSTAGADYSAGFHELGAYCHGPGIHAPQSAYELLINKDKWNELPADLKAIVTNAAEASVTWMMAMQDYDDTVAMDKLKEYGTKFVYLPEELQKEIVEIANKKYDEIATEDEFFARVLESQRDFANRYRAFKDFEQPNPSLMIYGAPITYKK